MVESFRPGSLEEAVRIRASKKALPFAGGTDLMVRYHYESSAVPDFHAPVLFLGHLKELRSIRRMDRGVSVGAAVTLSEILDSELIPGLLKEAAATIAAPGIRNAATMAGNICNASPAGDTICALYALDAGVKLTSPKAERIVPISRFITGPGKTRLNNDELLTEIIIPDFKESFHYFRKVGTRRANALSKLSIAGTVRISDETVEDIRIAVGAVAPTVVRSMELEKQMTGLKKSVLRERAEDIFSAYGDMIRPIDDQRSTARYRKQVALNLLRYFLFEMVLQKE
jgi:CO/xanthine dehydrogenase FAD-binding subunit